MPRRHRPCSRPFTSSTPALCQPLESRFLPAGNVTVAFDGLDLEITGDSAANSVEVRFDGVDVIVRGLNGTTINGGGADFLAAPATNTLPGELLFDLQKGNDFVYIDDGVVITGDVIVTPSAGNDTTVLKDMVCNADLILGTPLGLGADDPGQDRVVLDTVTAGTIFVTTGTGHDLVFFDAVTALQDVILTTGAGNDGINFDANVTDNLNIALGAGNDLLIGRLVAGGFSIDLEAGNDAMQLIDVTQNDPTRLATINLGVGNDKGSIAFGAASFVSQLFVTGSTGIDRFFLAPGTVLGDGLLQQEIESAAPYILLADPTIEKQFAATSKRFMDLAAFLGSLP